MNTNKPFLSLIIPLYNENTRLLPGLSAVVSYLKKQPYTWEILLVDDGSDVPVRSTIEAAIQNGDIPKVSLKSDMHILRLPVNSGKGAAIRKGMESSRGHVMVFCDIDMSVPIDTLDLMIRKLKQFPVVITSRRLTTSRIVVHQKWAREFSGRIFTWLSNRLCRTGVADVTCGFKGFRREAAMHIFRIQRINRWVFDTEIIFLSRKFKYEVRQIAVAWSDKPGSKVRAFDSVRSLVDLLKIRWVDLTGGYNY